MRSFYFIVNSRIGKKNIENVEQHIHKLLASHQCIIKYTTYSGHATVLAHEAILLANNIVVAVGGDGTVNEIVQVLAHTDVPLGIIPMGSGNGLARHCGIPIQLDKAVAILAVAKEIEIDLGIANSVFFISNAGVGYDAVICNAIKEKKSRGLKMYMIKVLQFYFTYKKDEYTISTDDKFLKQKAFFLNVANGKEFGYGFQIAPNASLQDGLLDVILAKNMNVLNGISFVIDGWRKRLHKNKNCIYFTTKKIKIEGQQLKYFQTDGDAHPCNGSCEIAVRKNALKLLVPQSVDIL